MTWTQNATPAPSPQLLGDPLPDPNADPCEACKNEVCKNVPAGENRIVICDGTTLTTIAGTAIRAGRACS